MKAILLAISLFFAVNQIQAKSPVVDESSIGGEAFDHFQENSFKVRGFKNNEAEKQLRNPSSNGEVKEKKKEEEMKPMPWIYSE